MLFRSSVQYDADPVRLAQVAGMLRSAVDACQEAVFERAHLVANGAAGFEFELVFVVAGSDYALYLQAQQQILLSIAEKFAESGLRYAPLPPR